MRVLSLLRSVRVASVARNRISCVQYRCLSLSYTNNILTSKQSRISARHFSDDGATTTEKKKKWTKVVDEETSLVYWWNEVNIYAHVLSCVRVYRLSAVNSLLAHSCLIEVYVAQETDETTELGAPCPDEEWYIIIQCCQCHSRASLTK